VVADGRHRQDAGHSAHRAQAAPALHDLPDAKAHACIAVKRQHFLNGTATRAHPRRPPPLSCDCQFHIYDDPKAYPPKPGALYDPPRATFEDMRGVLRKLGFARGVIVHAMPYDTDHRLLIDTLSGVADRENIRAVAIIKDNVSDAELSRLNELGVRGPASISTILQRDAIARGGAALTGARSRDRLARETARGGATHPRICPDIQHHQGHDVCRRSHGTCRLLGGPHLFSVLVAHRPAQASWLVADALQRQPPFEYDDGWDDAVPFAAAYVEAHPTA